MWINDRLCFGDSIKEKRGLRQLGGLADLRLGKNATRRAPCVLRDAPRLRRAAPQHEDRVLMALIKIRHPEVPREARPRRTHGGIPGHQYSCPASIGGRNGFGVG